MSENLPVNLFATYLHGKAPQFRREEIRSIANLYQTVLEVERDGDRLQDLYSLHRARPAGLCRATRISRRRRRLSDYRTVAGGQACVSPVGQSAAEWQIAGRKIWNWGEKNLHIRDAGVLADELLAEPDVKALEPR